MSDDDRQDPTVVQTVNDSALEWMFQPRTYGELLCRWIGIEQFETQIAKAAAYDGPDGMPHRFRDGPLLYARIIVDNEKIYQEEWKRRRAKES